MNICVIVFQHLEIYNADFDNKIILSQFGKMFRFEDLYLLKSSNCFTEKFLNAVEKSIAKTKKLTKMKPTEVIVSQLSIAPQIDSHLNDIENLNVPKLLLNIDKFSDEQQIAFEFVM